MFRQFLDQLEPPFTGEELFDHIPNVVFFIKNLRGEYLVVNTTMVERWGRSKAALLGRTAGQALPRPYGCCSEEQDRIVLQTGQPLVSQLEMHAYPSRAFGWCLTTKVPLRTRLGGVAGLVGVSQDLRLPDLDSAEYMKVVRALDYAQKNLSAEVSVSRLASVAGMSAYQLNRRMLQVFDLTTGQWLQKLRIDLARRKLRETDSAIATIAQDVGYSDQSAFTRHFGRMTGMSPGEFRSAVHTESW